MKWSVVPRAYSLLFAFVKYPSRKQLRSRILFGLQFWVIVCYIREVRQELKQLVSHIQLNSVLQFRVPV